MTDSYEIKKAKIDSLVRGFTNSGFKSKNRINQEELLQFLNKRTSSGNFDNKLSEKLFEVINLDGTSTIFVEDFVNGFLNFEEDIRRNIELLNIKLNQEQERYAQLVEELKKYKTDKRKLEGIKEIIIKVIYNEKSEELHFKIGDINSNEMLNKSFAFKPSSRKDHFEFIMKGVNDRNQVFDIGSKIFPLTDINSYEEYAVEIVVPEIENEEEIAAYIHAKIVLYWSDYKYYERLIRKAESKLKKLTSALIKAKEYLKSVREIYGDLTKKTSELVVNFNNQKLMERKGGKINVNFNNEKEAEVPGGNYVVEFNNAKEVEQTEEPPQEQLKEVQEFKESLPYITPVEEEYTIQETQPYITPVEEYTIQETQPYITPVEENTIQETRPYITSVEENTIQETGPYISSVEEYTTQETGPYITSVEENTIQETGPYISSVEEHTIQETGPYTSSVEENTTNKIQEAGPYFSSTEETQNVEYLNTIPVQTDYNYQSEAQFETTNVVENGGQEYNIDELLQQNITSGAEITTTTTNETTNYEFSNGHEGMVKAETIGYGASDTKGNVEEYGTGGYEYIDQNQDPSLIKSEIKTKSEIRTTLNRTKADQSTDKTLITSNTLPVNELEDKTKEPIIDSNDKTLPSNNENNNTTVNGSLEVKQESNVEEQGNQ